MKKQSRADDPNEILRRERVMRRTPAGGVTSPSKKTNTVIIMSDGHNAFASSPYGHPVVETPNLQWLADRGTVFENAYAPGTPCLPARTAFFTGLRVHQAGAYTNTLVGLRHDFPNYGSALAAQGVHTVLAGNSYVYNHGENLGFSEVIYPQNIAAPEDLASGTFHLERAPHEGPIDLPETDPGDYGVEEDVTRETRQRMLRDRNITQYTIDWLKTRAKALDRPWVLTMGLIKPHPPYVTSDPALWDLYRDRGDLPVGGTDAATAHHPYALDLRASHGRAYPDEVVRRRRAGYYARVSELDRQIGSVIATLRELDLLETTNVIYASDHGDMLGTFGLWGKNILFEDAVRIPMIACGPDYPAGSRVKTVVDLHDLQASIFESCGATRPDEWVGIPLQRIPEDDEERVVFSECHGAGLRAGTFMVRKGRWKLIYCFDAPHQLFDLADDPHELTNVYAQNPHKADELERELRGICDPEAENRQAFAFYGRPPDPD